MIKYCGKKFGGYIAILNFRVKYYFYWIVESLGDDKVLAKVWANGVEHI